MTLRNIQDFFRREYSFALSVPTCVVLALVGESIWSRLEGGAILAVSIGWMLAVLLTESLSVIRHAERLAESFGEPYGTLILTLAVTAIEITTITTAMLHEGPNPTLTRDTLLAVVMIGLNGMIGLSLLLGGWRHREQEYNLQGSNVYLSVTIPLVVLSLVLPVFTQTTPGPTFSLFQQIFLIGASLGLYAVFLFVQTGRHRAYFTVDEAAHPPRTPRAARPRGVAGSVVGLVLHLALALYLAEEFARPIDYLVETLHAPAALGGILLAAMVAAPESIGAVRASLDNRLQRAVNISLGSVLSTIGLTIPTMVIVSLVTGRTIVLGVEHADLVLLLLTLTVTIVTFSSGRTNIVQGFVHLLLLATFVMLVFRD